MRVDLFVAISEDGTDVEFERDQDGTTKDSHLAKGKLTTSQARKLYGAARDAFNKVKAEFAQPT